VSRRRVARGLGRALPRNPGRVALSSRAARLTALPFLGAQAWTATMSAQLVNDRGLISICAAGGMAGAMLVTRD